jgi:hypothetical protein
MREQAQKAALLLGLKHNIRLDEKPKYGSPIICLTLQNPGYLKATRKLPDGVHT